MNAGMIFVRTHDLLSSVFRAIIKEPYNYIGFYVRSDVLSHTRVWIVDVCTSSEPEWLAEHTLESLSEHPLVSEIALRELIKNGDYGAQVEHFKLSVCNALQNHTPLNYKEGILKILGNNCNVCEDSESKCEFDWCGKVKKDLINTVLTNYGIYEEIRGCKIKQSDYTMESTYLYSVIAYRTFTVKKLNDVAGISHYLGENKYFQDVKTLDSVNTITNWDYIQKYNASQTSYITEFWTLLQHMCTHIPQFYKECIVNNDSHKLNKTVNHLLKLTRSLLYSGNNSSRPRLEEELKTISTSLNSLGLDIQ